MLTVLLMRNIILYGAFVELKAKAVSFVINFFSTFLHITLSSKFLSLCMILIGILWAADFKLKKSAPLFSITDEIYVSLSN